jgi:hypothetical protein
VVAPDHRLLPAQTGATPHRESAWGRVPFYPVLLALALVGVAYIQTDVSVLATLRTLGVVAIGSTALMLLCGVVVRNRHLAALIAAAAIVVLRTSDLPHTLVALLLLGLTGLALFYFARVRHASILPGATRLLDIGSIALVAVLIVQAVGSGIPSRVAEDLRRSSAIAATGGEVADDPPDVYMIMLEDYPRADTLRRLFGFDNSAFLDSLASGGFAVATDSRSNYMYTALNLSALLQMAYPDTAATTYPTVRLRALINDNPVFDRLHEAGYTIFSSASRWEGEAVRSADVYCGSDQVNEFEFQMIRDSLVGSGLDLVAPGWQAARDRSVVNAELSCAEAASQAAVQGPRFVWAHIEAPHIPIVFDALGNPASASVYSDTADGVKTTQTEFRRAYVAQLQFLNSRVLGLIQRIRDRSAQPPVTVVMSDEGSESRLDWHDAAKSDLRERFGILFAAATPGHPALFGDRPVTVNVFPALLNAYFGTAIGLQDPRYFVSSTADRPAVTETGDPFASP